MNLLEELYIPFQIVLYWQYVLCIELDTDMVVKFVCVIPGMFSVASCIVLEGTS